MIEGQPTGSEPDPLTIDPDPLTARDLQHMAMRGSIWTAMHAITAVPLAFVANAVVARALGVTDYGSLAVLTIAFTLVTQVANAGFTDAVVRTGAEFEARRDSRSTDALLQRSLGFHLLVELPALWVFSLVVARGESPIVVMGLLLSSLITCSFGGASLFLTLANRSAAGAKLAMASNLLVQAAVASTAVATQDPLAVITARLLASAALVPVSLLAVPRERRRTLLKPSLPGHLPTGFWKFAAQSFLVGLIGLLVFSRSEVILLGWLSSSKDVGLFALAFGLSVQITAPVDAMLNPIAPAVTGVLSSRPELARPAFLRASRFSSLLCALITGVLIPVVYFAIPLVYGEEFRQTANLLLPLAAVSCIQSMGQTVSAFAFARQQGGRLLRVNIAGLVINIAFGIVLILAFGVWGAVLANVVGQLTSVLLLTFGELRIQSLSWWSYLGTVRIWLVSAATSALAIFGTASLIESRSQAAAVLVSGVAGLALLLTMSRVTSAGLGADDVSAMVEACPRRTRPAVRLLMRPFLQERQPETL
jgi:O-antigen/teichoic acid export membrane protein